MMAAVLQENNWLPKEETFKTKVKGLVTKVKTTIPSRETETTDPQRIKIRVTRPKTPHKEDPIRMLLQFRLLAKELVQMQTNVRSEAKLSNLLLERWLSARSESPTLMPRL